MQLTRVVFSFALVFGFGCSPSSSEMVDAPPGTGPKDAPKGSPDAPSGSFQCRNATSNYGSGQHNAGQDCMNCHSNWTVAGTLYTTATGSTPAAGATVTVIDANNHSLDLVVQANGNFYTQSSVTFPITLYASDCPTVQMMTAQMTSANNNNGGCNQTGCHGFGSSQPHIHL